MFYLCLAIIANTTMAFAMKYSETHQGNRYAATFVNYVVGVLVTYLLMNEKIFFYATKEGYFAIGLAIFNAICMTSCLLFIQYSIGKNGVPISTTFNRLGILIPTILSMIFFHELPTILQLAGIIVAVFAIIYINGGKGEKKNITAPTILIVIFIIGGLIDFNSKLYGIFGNPEIRDYYIFYTFIFNTLFSLCIMLKMNPSIKKTDVRNGVLMGIPNQLVMYCLVRAAAALPAYIVFPLLGGSVILGVNVINFLVFKEKLSKREMAATAMIMVALVLLNL